jgi:hypothetical protein
MHILQKRIQLVIGAVTLCLGMCAYTAHAEYIQFTLTGEVTDVTGLPWDPWSDTQVGDAFQLQYIFDSDAQDTVSGSNHGRYSFIELSVSIGSNMLSTTEGYIDIDYQYGPLSDYYSVHFDFTDQLSGWGGMAGEDMLPSDALPTDLDWTQFASTDFWGVINSHPAGQGPIYYVITDFQSAVVPATPTLFIFATCMFARRRRQ